MKIKSVSTLVLLASVALLSTATGCTKRQTPVSAYPNTQQQYGQNGYADQNLASNYNPYQQGVGANPAYYGDSNYNIDNSGSWDTTTTTPGTTTPDMTGGLDIPVGGDLGSDLGDDFDIPSDLPNLEPYAPPSGTGAGGNYMLAGSFMVDQDNYLPPAIPVVGSLLPTKNQWQASGVAVVGSDLVVTATDKSGLFKKGTVITMSAETGQNWKNIGSAWLGTRHPMDATVRNIVFDGNGKLFANDSTNLVYVLSEPSFSVEKLTSSVSGSTDLAVSGNNIILATSSGLKKFDSSSVASPSDFAAGVNASGIGNDAEGNIYAISGTTIKKVAPDGTATDVVSGVSGAIDVTVTNSGNIMVLTSGGIKMYTATGELKNTFGSGDYLNATAITTDGEALFVADAGSSYKDSKVLKYSTMTL